MNAYAELDDDVRWQRELRRSRLLALIRGWLRKERAPRLTVVLLLIPCAVCIVLSEYLMRRAGFELLPMRWAFAVLPAWPLFVALVRWRAAAEWERLNLKKKLGREYQLHDESAEAVPFVVKTQKQLEWDQGVQSGIRGGLQQNGVGRIGAVPWVLFIMVAVTIGTWLVWELIKGGPKLLANTIIDSELVPSQPKLVFKMETYKWFPETLGATALHFLGLALAAFLLGIGCLAYIK